MSRDTSGGKKDKATNNKPDEQLDPGIVLVFLGILSIETETTMTARDVKESYTDLSAPAKQTSFSTFWGDFGTKNSQQTWRKIKAEWIKTWCPMEESWTWTEEVLWRYCWPRCPRSCICQERLSGPFLNGLFSSGFSRGTVAHQDIRENGPFWMDKRAYQG